MNRRTYIPMLLALAQMCIAAPQDAWKQSMEAGNTALARRDYATARSAFEAAVTAAEEDQSLTLEAMRKVASTHRLLGDFAGAEQVLTKAVPVAVRASGDNSETVAAVLSELAGAQRAQRKLKEAMLTLDSCVRTRQAVGSKPADTVRDLAMLARTLQELEDFDRAGKRWQEALDLWDSAMPQDSPEIVGVVDALAGLHRDKAEYDVAETLLRRSLATREAAFGPESTEMIPTLDSLAYVLFGLKKYSDAEPYYRRLLNIWKTSAGPDHPMVALTLEKMTEFYAAQERYAEAEPLASEALAIRTVAHLRNLHQYGRVTLMQAKLPEADAIYKQAIRIGDDARMPDEVMDPMLRVHAQLLRELKRPAEAAVLEKRVKAAFLRNTNIRPSPVKVPASK